MTQVALLNPQLELEGARAMVASARTHLERIEDRLKNVVLDREEYLKAIGSAQAVRELLQTLETQYRTLVNR